MKDSDLTSEQIAAIKKAFDNTLTDSVWQESNFLRAMKKRLEHIREEFLLEVGDKDKDRIETSSNLANRVALRAGQQEIFISLYTSNGGQLTAWEKIIVNLPRQLISRPVYAGEKEVIDRIKSKANPENEAYICAYIDKSDIKDLPEDKIPHDRLNKPLLTIKDKALSLENITRFVHSTGTYQYVDGRLELHSRETDTG